MCNFFPSSFTSRRILNDQDASGLLTPPRVLLTPAPAPSTNKNPAASLRAAWGKGVGKEEGGKKYYTKPTFQ